MVAESDGSIVSLVHAKEDVDGIWWKQREGEREGGRERGKEGVRERGREGEKGGLLYSLRYLHMHVYMSLAVRRASDNR